MESQGYDAPWGCSTRHRGLGISFAAGLSFCFRGAMMGLNTEGAEAQQSDQGWGGEQLCDTRRWEIFSDWG